MLFDLFKLRIGVVIALTALAGVLVTPAAGPGWPNVLVLVLAVLVSSAAAGAFNQYYEVDLDRRMKRTLRRPFVTGALRHHKGWVLAIGGLVVLATAAAWGATNGWAALFTFLGAFVYAVVYTVWLKRRTWWNIVVGGSAGSFAVLAGASAVSPTLSPEAILLSVILFLWTPPHFWSLAIAFRDDYRAAGVPMLPVARGDRVASRAILAHTIVLVALSIGLTALAPGLFYGACALGGGTLFLLKAWRLARHPSRANALGCFHASLIQLSLVLVGVMVDGSLRVLSAG
jgi:protoheme IX farnesyltransferase